MPFLINMGGVYVFRLHADYGLGKPLTAVLHCRGCCACCAAPTRCVCFAGAYVGVDGAQFAGGNTYGHMVLDPVSLVAGEHEFESLGFEDCCDGHSELEVHLPCDSTGSPWRFAIVGVSDCLACGEILAAECSA